MKTILLPRKIINRHALLKRLDDKVDYKLEKDLARSILLDELLEALGSGRFEIRSRFESGKTTGSVAVSELSYLNDQIVRIVYDFACKKIFRVGIKTKGEKICILGVGGYGRGELAPGSDLDLLFLLPYKNTPLTENLVEYILYILWDLGLKVGHAVRTINENIKYSISDMTIRTALLEARWIWGDRILANEFMHRFQSEVVDGTSMSFVSEKLRERDERHQKHGDSRYILEPDIKEHKGGLRDLHTLNWIVTYLYNISSIKELVDLKIINEEVSLRFEKAHDFLWTVRIHIHYLTGRPENRLTFDIQNILADKMGYAHRPGMSAVERFMKHYFLIAKDVGDLTRIFSAVLEEKEKRKPFLNIHGITSPKELEGFLVEGGRISLAHKDDFNNDPLKILNIFYVAQKNNLDLHPNAVDLVIRNLYLVGLLRDDDRANEIFINILISRKRPDAILRLMNETGVFGRFIPDFGRVVAQMQFDMYHVYTTDEHTIRCIGILSRIEAGHLKDKIPFETKIVNSINSRRSLYVALLLHDIAKGRGGDHSKIGSQIALNLCPRLGLNPEETESVCWLVKNHLLMSNTAFKRDLDDPSTIMSFCDLVQSLERIKLLYLLTVADIKAVGPNVWNEWKAALLRELYSKSVVVLSGGHVSETIKERIDLAKSLVAKKLSHWDDSERSKFISLGTPSYWLSYNTESHMNHANLIRSAEEDNQEIFISFQNENQHSGTDILVYAPDHPGLFSRIAGALSLSRCRILYAKIQTLSNGMALDTFTIQNFKEEYLYEDFNYKNIENKIRASIEDRIILRKELAKMYDRNTGPKSAFESPPRVIIDNNASNFYSIIEINGHDRPGFLFNITNSISELGLQISSAHISTYGERVVDVFYVKDIFGVKVDNERKIIQIKDSLSKSIGLEDQFTVHNSQSPDIQPAAE